VCRHTQQQEEEMAIAGTRTPMAIWPRGVDVGVHPSGPPAGGGVRAWADTGDSARAEEAQVARERALHQRGKAQRAALLEQAEEEKKTIQQARLASIREQQAALVRWFSAMRVEANKKLAEAQLAATEILTSAEARREPAEARRKPAEARLAATEGLALEEGPKQLQREPAELRGSKESEELKGLKESATGAEKAANAKAAMDKPARPPERLNEQFAVTSAVFVQEPGEPAQLKEPGGPAELMEPEKPGEPAGLKEPKKPGEPAELKEPRGLAGLKELQGMRRAREGGTAAEADTVRVRREAERFAEDAKMDPSNCLMEILTLKENQEGIRIRRSRATMSSTFPGS
jgi:hypothetical protein